MESREYYSTGHDYQEYAKARNAAKTETRRAVRDFEKEVAKQAKKNPKAFYRYVNSKLNFSVTSSLEKICTAYRPSIRNRL